jgi:hypothetical protein
MSQGGVLADYTYLMLITFDSVFTETGGSASEVSDIKEQSISLLHTN